MTAFLPLRDPFLYFEENEINKLTEEQVPDNIEYNIISYTTFLVKIYIVSYVITISLCTFLIYIITYLRK